jgi:hypothetical protein
MGLSIQCSTQCPIRKALVEAGFLPTDDSIAIYSSLLRLAAECNRARESIDAGETKPNGFSDQAVEASKTGAVEASNSGRLLEFGPSSTLCLNRSSLNDHRKTMLAEGMEMKEAAKSIRWTISEDEFKRTTASMPNPGNERK